MQRYVNICEVECATASVVFYCFFLELEIALSAVCILKYVGATVFLLFVTLNDKNSLYFSHCATCYSKALH